MKIEQFYSVTQVNRTIKELFDNIPLFRNITIKGEVSNFHGRNKSGHLYFSLKDESSSISVAIFKYDALRLGVEFKNGDLIYATGSISSYPANGTYQLICKQVMVEGEGDLLKKKELLKKKLFEEGLFDASHKKELPLYPEKIAIITGKNSAAAKDFEYNLKRRYPIVKLELIYSLVQGEEAPKELIKSLKEAIKTYPDVIIIGRGGGSNDDLNAFDDEGLVREIYACPIPVLSAVGHEINLSLCDLVADKHASTPTGAAELAVPNLPDVIDEINQLNSYLESLINHKLTSLENILLKLEGSKCFKDINSIFDIYLEKIKQYHERINKALDRKIERCSFKVDSLKKTLDIVNPENVLTKGYSLLLNEKGEVIKSVKDISISEEISIKVNDGTLKAVVKEKNYNGK